MECEYGGFVLIEQRCVLDADGQRHTVLPDVAWWSVAQLPSLPVGPVSEPPTLAVEVLSPSDRYGDVQEKVTVCLQAGVPLVWVADTRARNVTVYRTACVPVVFVSPSVLQDPLLPGLRIDLAEIDHSHIAPANSPCTRLCGLSGIAFAHTIP